MSFDSSSDDDSSVSDWIVSLKRGSVDASQKIWHWYVDQLVREADRQLKNLPRRTVDAEDIVQEAFAGFFSGVAANRFSKLDDRNDLWQLLIMLTDRRAKDHMRRYLGPRRGLGRVRGDSVLNPTASGLEPGEGGFDNLVAPRVTPDSAAALIQLIQNSFPALADELLQKIALDRVANYSVREIAERHGMSLRSAERKLELISQILKSSTEASG